jgi:hypothetical protein
MRCEMTMYAILIEGDGHRPMIRFEDGRQGVPVNLDFRSRTEFLGLVGRRVEVLSRFSDHHYSVRLAGQSVLDATRC